jgi:hypothetical protein
MVPPLSDRVSNTPLLHFVATSATFGMQSAGTFVVRRKTAVGRCRALYRAFDSDGLPIGFFGRCGRCGQGHLSAGVDLR